MYMYLFINYQYLLSQESTCTSQKYSLVPRLTPTFLYYKKVGVSLETRLIEVYFNGIILVRSRVDLILTGG